MGRRKDPPKDHNSLRVYFLYLFCNKVARAVKTTSSGDVLNEGGYGGGLGARWALPRCETGTDHRLLSSVIVFSNIWRGAFL